EANAPGSSLPSAARAAARISLLGATTPVNPGQARTTIVAPAPPQAPVDPRAPVRRMVTDGWRMGNWGEHFADTWLGRTIGYTPRAERERQKRQAEREARQSPAPTPENHSLQSDRNDIYEDYNRGLISEEERDRRINEL
ncbi:MAG TPA: hypothetical protein VLA92_01660, partial [Candidatus Saccharimonadales bacterium]|nr:hypothetical protein [Candidatus Saccharimonadales bacterium]